MTRPSCPGCSAGPPPISRPSWAPGTNVRSSTATTWYCCREREMSVHEQGRRAKAAATVLATATRATKDAALLAMAAALVRGSSSAARSNAAIVDVLRDALADAGLPADAVQLVDATSRDSVKELMRARGLVDVLIPRGGAALIRSVVEESTVPVIETGVGNCHVYVDADADLDMALSILLNAKTQRVSVCNAAETLPVHPDG